jgi:hypothetical protein
VETVGWSSPQQMLEELADHGRACTEDEDELGLKSKRTMAR